MPRATTCLLDHVEVSISDALISRDDARLSRQAIPDFRCVECGEAVRPHKGGGRAGAHFEHLRRNPHCPRSDPARR